MFFILTSYLLWVNLAEIHCMIAAGLCFRVDSSLNAFLQRKHKGPVFHMRGSMNKSYCHSGVFVGFVFFCGWPQGHTLAFILPGFEEA